MNLKGLDGYLVLSPDSRELTHLERQKREIEQARQQALPLLTQASG